MKFRTIILSIATLLTFSVIAPAQDERNKVETYIGYSYLSTDTGLEDIDSDFDNRLGSNGINASITGNPHRYIGIKGDFSFHQKSESDGTDRARFRTTQILGGIQFKDNKVEGGRFRPFAHILAGLANQGLSAQGVVGTTTFDINESTNNFAMVWGGGIDMRVNDRVSIRVIQADYNPIFFRDQDYGTFSIQGRTQSNFRIGAGIVFH